MESGSQASALTATTANFSSGMVSVIDPATHVVTATIFVGGGPVGVAVDPGTITDEFIRHSATGHRTARGPHRVPEFRAIVSSRPFRSVRPNLSVALPTLWLWTTRRSTPCGSGTPPGDCCVPATPR
ncbi:hypothetical protein [Mycobacterium gastri]|uniref:hypothetical protein n=1 Tax=Mycobacterium gastri TaxID=1777 RepID=UPI0009FE89AA